MPDGFAKLSANGLGESYAILSSMAVVLVIHYYIRAGGAKGFQKYEAQALELFQRHGGEVVANFTPAQENQDHTPGRIHVLRIHSAAAYNAYAHDPAMRELRQRFAGAVRQIETFSSHSLSEHEPGLHTVVSGKRISVDQKMRALRENWEAAQDRRAIFAHLYLLMTGNMLQALQAGEFHDKVWVRTLLETFAGYYFKALEKFEEAWFTAPPVWRVAFEAAQDPQVTTIQHLLLGMNAHITHDLVFTLIDMLEPEWEQITPANKKARYHDHMHVNEVIARTVDVVQDQIIAQHAPVLDALGPVYRNFDEWVVSKLVQKWRGQVWNQAIEYLEFSHFDDKNRVRQQVEYIALRRTDLILLKRGPFKMPALY